MLQIILLYYNYKINYLCRKIIDLREIFILF